MADDESLDEFMEREGKGQSDDLPADVEILKNEVRRLRKKLHMNSGKEDLILQSVREHLDENPPDLRPIKKPKRDRRTKNEEIAVLHYSDPQFGKITSSYDSSVAMARAELLAQKTVYLTEIRRNAAPVKECRVYLGGDIVEGEQIFPGQMALIDNPLIEQACNVAPSAIAKMVRHLLEHFEKVRVIAVPGNHGRNSRHGDPKTNWDMVACRVAMLMLSDPNGKLLPRLEFEAPGTFYYIDRVFDWGNLIVHGDQIRGGFAGFPWYGVGKKAAGWADSIKEPWDYLWFGHFHTMTSGTLNHRTFLANGTTESDNEYALEQLAAAGWPVQRLAFFSAHHGLISDNPVWLTNERRSQAQRWAEWTDKLRQE
jgi:hypothetical protein